MWGGAVPGRAIFLRKTDSRDTFLPDAHYFPFFTETPIASLLSSLVLCVHTWTRQEDVTGRKWPPTDENNLPMKFRAANFFMNLRLYEFMIL